ncbi:alpha-L-fucosidase [Rhizoctonia solani]|uniref:alpha-L-fucosidase n=1 Tax=Rhizoctonia solani TaxID=456999 RepID=A0A0K6GAA3_9AGAM|nr:alpha-L-fucosidase [Rhizoctonia solani]
MRLKSWYLFLSVLSSGFTVQALSNFNECPPKLLPSIHIPLEHLFNNVGSGPNGNFDGAGGAFPADALPVGEFEYDRVLFQLPKFGSGKDNLVSNGQVIKLDEPQYIREIHVLYAGDHNNVSVKNWWTLSWVNKGVIQAPYHTTDYEKSINHNLTQIYHWVTTLKSNSPLRSITLPNTGSYNRFHLFALSLVPTGPLLGCAADAPHYGAQIPLALAPPVPGPQLITRRARLTRKLYEAFDRLGNPQELGGAQLVEVTLANMRPTAAWADTRCWGGPMHVWVYGNNLYTVQHGEISRLMPGDEVKVRVWVRNLGNVAAGTVGTMRVEIREARRQGNVISVSEEWPAVAGIPRYEESKESLGKHETPLWWDDAKFGIFIHWGVYSVPAWSPKGYYAAWYNWWLHTPSYPGNILRNYHKKVYGEDFVYDDFIPQFTASEFNASEWIQLFADAGAKYFVLVTKHHDGFSLFDTENSTHRSSVYLGPKRDFVAELMYAARAEHPELRRGTYYSLPEWFNPDFGPYGFGSFPGHLARNAYNDSKIEPYTGWLEGKEYLRDIQLAHMKALAHTYETEIMWCDLNGPNKTLEFAAEWYNKMVDEGREVALNNRCGAIPDFDTPEYTKFSSIQERKWETNEGIDPVCYAYNWETRDDEYKSPDHIINKIVDITSKNGNYLLNLGPTHTGRIIKPMVDRILEVGRWLKHSGSCVYETNYYYLGSDEGDLRFTRTPNTTCIIALSRPQNETIIIEKPIPLLTGDTINLLGAPLLKGGLEWSRHGGRTVIRVPEAQIDAVRHAWAFQIAHSHD